MLTFLLIFTQTQSYCSVLGWYWKINFTESVGVEKPWLNKISVIHYTRLIKKVSKMCSHIFWVIITVSKTCILIKALILCFTNNLSSTLLQHHLKCGCYFWFWLYVDLKSLFRLYFQLYSFSEAVIHFRFTSINKTFSTCKWY